ncbi:hypothetical protein EQG49_13500 [Periweissella cryptocerci]|uniref:Uncharacterized protein n=1 Tax=Periweissella cryptocerci TaxID=2506420 RepID=A0A4P6YXC3_9LACO|nr:hypothetical protein [Periweissella cryptocerci]QBO37413.1 hypothetical protein EQG49_13500 [Periweissella cryptocerci]
MTALFQSLLEAWRSLDPPSWERSLLMSLIYAALIILMLFVIVFLIRVTFKQARLLIKDAKKALTPSKD